MESTIKTWEDLGAHIGCSDMRLKVYHTNRKGFNFQYKKGGAITETDCTAFLQAIGKGEGQSVQMDVQGEVAPVQSVQTDVQTLNFVEQQVEQLEQQCSTLNNELNIERSKCSDLNDALNKERSKFEQLEQQRFRLERDLNASVQKCSDLNNQVQKSSNVEQQLNAERSKVQNLERLIQSTSKEVQNLNSKVQQGSFIQNELSASVQKCSDLNDALNKAVQKCSDFEQQLNAERSKSLKSEQVVQKLNARLNESEQRVDTMGDDLIELSDQLKSVEKLNDDYHNKVLINELTIQGLTDKWNAAKEWKEKAAQLQVERDNLLLKGSDANGNLVALSKDNESLRKEVERHLSDLNNTLNKSEQLEQRLNESEQNVQTLNKSVQSVQIEWNKSEQNVQTLNKALIDSKLQIEQLNADKFKLLQNGSNGTTQAAVLSRDNADLRERLSKLEGLNTDLNSRLNTLNIENARLSTLHTVSSEQYSETASLKSDLETAFTQASKERDLWKGRFEQLNIEHSALQRLKKEIETTLGDAQKSFQELNHRVQTEAAKVGSIGFRFDGTFRMTQFMNLLSQCLLGYGEYSFLHFVFRDLPFGFDWILPLAIVLVYQGELFDSIGDSLAKDWLYGGTDADEQPLRQTAYGYGLFALLLMAGTVWHLYDTASHPPMEVDTAKVATVNAAIVSDSAQNHVDFKATTKLVKDSVDNAKSRIQLKGNAITGDWKEQHRILSDTLRLETLEKERWNQLESAFQSNVKSIRERRNILIHNVPTKQTATFASFLLFFYGLLAMFRFNGFRVNAIRAKQGVELESRTLYDIGKGYFISFCNAIYRKKDGL